MPPKPSAGSKRRKEDGFTLPELLVSLCICVLVLQSVYQWSLVAEKSQAGGWQARQALSLGQSALNGADCAVPPGWTVRTEKRPCGEDLTETEVTVECGGRIWHFYYVGEKGV